MSELIFGQAVEPWLFGRRMGLSPLAIVVAATFWTWLWGPIGLLLSTPLTMCLVVLGRHVEHLQFLDVLLGDRPPLLAEESLYIRLLGDDADQAAAEAETYLKENTLCRYYDDVALKALAIGDADARRGVLDYDRALKIKDSTVALIQNLSDVQTDESERAEAVQDETGDASVLCIGGRGPLDEAASLLLVSLLQKADVNARLANAQEASEMAAQESDGKAVKAVCVCYLDPTNAARAAFLMRRIKRRLPGAAPIVAFLGTDVGSVLGGDGYRVVATLDGAIQAIAAALAEDAAIARQPSPERDAPVRGIGAGIGLEPLAAG